MLNWPETIGRLKLCTLLSFLALLARQAQALDWTAETGYRYATVRPSIPGKAGFTRLESRSTGVLFTNMVPPE